VDVGPKRIGVLEAVAVEVGVNDADSWQALTNSMIARREMMAARPGY